MNTCKIGFIVNPIAGCGQIFNLKGSDFITPEKCLESISLQMAKKFVELISDLDVTCYAASGRMGADSFNGEDQKKCIIVYQSPHLTSRNDTVKLARTLESCGVQLIVFFGGDGTAVDLVDANIVTPLLGVPSGTKMFSSVFAISLNDAVRALRAYLLDPDHSTAFGDVLKVEEKDYSNGRLTMSVYGQLRIPLSPMIVTSCKGEYADTGVMDIVEYMQDNVASGTNYIIGPGSTCKRIKELFGNSSTFSGFDLMRDGKIISLDLSEKQIYDISSEQTKIVISPLGGQGFLLGRGNKQISSRVMDLVGFGNLIVVSSIEKISKMSVLYVDLGTDHLKIPGYIKVLYGYGIFKLVKLES